MRSQLKLLALSALLTTEGCYGIGALEALGGSCPQEQLVVTWPITITRGTSTTSTLITRTMIPDNIGQTQHNLLRQLLVEGGASGTYNVTWTVPAFDTNGGHISLRHAAPLANGETQQVSAVFSGGAWTAQPATTPLPPAISVTANNFTAASASGSITAVTGLPLRLSIDVTTTSTTGETIRLTGEAGFAYQKVTTTCIP